MENGLHMLNFDKADVCACEEKKNDFHWLVYIISFIHTNIVEYERAHSKTSVWMLIGIKIMLALS